MHIAYKVCVPAQDFLKCLYPATSKHPKERVVHQSVVNIRLGLRLGKRRKSWPENLKCATLCIKILKQISP